MTPAPAGEADSEMYARTGVPEGLAVAEEVITPDVEEPQSRPLPVPARTIPLLILFLATGTVILAFTMLTVNRRQPAELLAHGMTQRIHFATTYWMEHGYFHTGGVPVRQGPANSVYFHRSSTGGRLIGGFIVQKVYASITGRYSWRLMGLYNQLVVLVTATLLALLVFRLAVRAGARPLHALVLAVSLEAVFFTFPDNLALFWGSSGREYWLLFTAIFLLAEERCAANGRTRAITIVQGVSVFLLTYMEYIAGLGFVVSYAVATLIFEGDRATLKRVAVTCIAPALFAIAVHRGQLAYVGVMLPDIPQQGSGFLFRTGLDGSAQYYTNHLDIAYHRDWGKNYFPNYELLFRWKWLFFAGTAAVLGVFIGGLRGKVPRSAIVALAALLGSYLLTAAVFSQAVLIHPYLYDVMLLTPLIMALFVMAPVLVESITQHRGIIVIAVFFLAVWVSMVQVRRYALQYPQPPTPAPAARTGE